MGKNSIRLTVETMSNWRSGLTHIKEAKRKMDDRNRNRNKKNYVEKKRSFK